MTYLLDVNVLVALLDPAHVHHKAAQTWFDTIGHPSWATCAITQNGALRVLAHAAYRNAPGSFSAIQKELLIATRLPGHLFWDESVSLLDATLDLDRLTSPRHITDLYLLMLAKSHGAALATFDRHIPIDALSDGIRSLHLIEG